MVIEMKKQALNPYLPSYEYVPDGEPYVFGDRVYVYGSHDRFGGKGFCLNDYVCWSAPVDDLGDWRNEGVIYTKMQDPLNVNGKQNIYAPDLQKGLDGKYYLFYALNRSTVISVAVCETPAGKYEFHGHVSYPDSHICGTKEGEIHNFDPGVFIDEDGRIYLYTGFSPVGLMYKILKKRKRLLEGSYVIELEQDMITIKGEPKLVLPGPRLAVGTDFEANAFYEASSMRKIGDIYYLIYSSINSHELCYAISKYPDKDFVYGGVLVSNGDIGIEGNTKPLNYTGNTHGSMVQIKDEWYVFYHRHTNRNYFSRQGCAERLEMNADGSINQAEITSCGLNGEPLSAIGEYEARIACNLSSKKGTTISKQAKKGNNHPYFTQSGNDREANGDQYIANMKDEAWSGFKYFAFNGENEISITVRGKCSGFMIVTTGHGSQQIAKIPVEASNDWKNYSTSMDKISGKQALYFTFIGKGALDFKSFKIS